MELQNMISASMGMELPSTLVFDYPSLRAMSGFIESQMGVAPAEAPAQAAVLSGPSAPAQGGARSAHLAGLAARAATAAAAWMRYARCRSSGGTWTWTCLSGLG